MGGSYIAFELDALNKAALAARAAGVTEDTIDGGLLRMWAHCFREKTAEVAALHVRGFFATDVDVVPALEAFGFLEPVPAGFRVRGADRYLRIAEARSKGGKAARGNLRRGTEPGPSAGGQPEAVPAPVGDQPGRSSKNGPAAPGSFTDDRRPTTDDRTPTTEGAPMAPDEVADDPPTKPRALLIGADPPDTVEAFFAWAREARATALGVVRERVPNGGRGLSAWFSQAMLEVGGDVRRLQAAYRAFLADAHWRSATPACPWAGWVAQWERFVPPAPADARPTGQREEIFRRLEPVLGEYRAWLLVDDRTARFHDDGAQLVVTVADPYQADTLREGLDAGAPIRVEYQPQAEGAAA